MMKKNNRLLLAGLLFSTLLHLVLLAQETSFFGHAPEMFGEIPVSIQQHMPDHESTKPVKQMDPISKNVGSSKGDRTGTGTAFNPSSLIKSYLEYITEVIHDHRFVPSSRRYAGLIGNASFRIIIEADGRFNDIQMVSSSGNTLLDETALNAIQSVNGRIKRPDWTGKHTIRAVITVKYQHDL